MRDLLLASRTAAAQKGPPRQRALVGFDGFVDTIVRAVDKRTNFDEYTPLPTITAFAERVGRAAGLSTGIEVVPTRVKLGGNSPIMTQALIASGLQVTYIGSVGKQSIHPVFQEMADACTTYAIADPGETMALEFTDGKLMLGQTESMKEITWDSILAVMGRDVLQQALTESDLVALVNWTMIPHMTSIWQSLIDEILPSLPVREPKPWFFVDLADPERRHAEEIAEAVALLPQFKSRFRTVLGLNRKEATEVATALQLDLGVPPAQAELGLIVPALAERLNLDGLVVHPTDEAAALFDGEYLSIPGPHTKSPLLTTGAGDNFNAGFCTGLVLGLAPKEALVLGKATSGFYVRNGYSPSWEELLAFLELWSENVGQDF